MAAVPAVQDCERVEPERAVGRIAAREVLAPASLPRVPRSAMDGYAVRREDLQGPYGSPPLLRLTGELTAGGTSGAPLCPGTCLAVSTGAPLPPGADVVAPLEWARREGDGVRILYAPDGRPNVIVPGEDMQAGTCLLREGRRIRARDLVPLAAYGIREIAVRRALKVALLATGDEVRAPGAACREAKVFDATTEALLWEVRSLGATALHFGHAPDAEDALRTRFDEVLACEPDAILTTGGESVGSRDLVPLVWERLGAKTCIRRVDVKPGGAFYAGIIERGAGTVRLFGLSGTPVAAMASYYLLVRRALAALAGLFLDDRFEARLAADLPASRRPRLVWARRDWRRQHWVPLQDAARLESIIRAEALLVLRDPSRTHAKGDAAEAVMLDAVGY